jgi:chromosome segregation ATPase
MALESIENFKDLKSQLKTALKNTKNWTINSERFGLEKEYSGSMLRGGIGSITIDLDALGKSDTQFIKITTSIERRQLNNDIKNLTANMALEDGEEISQLLDAIKSFLRSLNIRNSEHRYAEFIAATDELQLKSTSFSILIEKEKSELQLLTKSRQDLEASIEILEEVKNKTMASLQSVDEELSDLTSKLDELEEKNLK